MALVEVKAINRWALLRILASHRASLALSFFAPLLLPGHRPLAKRLEVAVVLITRVLLIFLQIAYKIGARMARARSFLHGLNMFN